MNPLLTHGASLAWLFCGAAAVLLPAHRLSERSRAGRDEKGHVHPLVHPVIRRHGLHAVSVVSVGLVGVLVAGPLAGIAFGTAMAPVAWLVVERLRARPRRPAADANLPLTLDLVGGALRAGRPVHDALTRAAPAASAAAAQELNQVAGLLRLGADAEQAWGVVRPDGPLAAVAPVATRSASSGIRVAAAFEELAGRLRDRAAAAGAARAQRAGIRAMGPLAACFLPSFVCLGVVPVVVGIAGQALRTVG